MVNYILKRLEINRGQLTTQEYRYIIPYLNKSNFLVFGTGNDSELWNYVNSGGNTVFLENQDRWIKPEYGNVIKVNYTCKITDHKRLLDEYRNGIYNNLIVDLPEDILNTKWDVIFIDSPIGYDDNCPGRMQSIYMGYLLSNKDTEVFIHDCNREVEDTYSREMFNIVGEIRRLRHLHKSI